MGTRLIGIGTALPERVVANSDLPAHLDTSDAWIVERTGIRQRHIAGESETTATLATQAARKAMESGDVAPDEIDVILVATSTPDLTFPATATLVQQALDIHHGYAFDLQAVCSGFVYGLHMADALLTAKKAKTALLIGAETFSRILDWDDRRTCVLFGDGAAAVILRRDAEHEGVISTRLRSDGAYRDMLYVDGGPSTTGTVGYLRMEGNKVFKRAVTDITGVIRECADQAGVSIAEIDWFVPHQANQRILSGVAKKLGISEDIVISTVALHANTSAASVPLALASGMADGRIKAGDLVMLEAFGGGFTWGAALMRI